jgi:hypothetical protein
MRRYIHLGLGRFMGLKNNLAIFLIFFPFFAFTEEEPPVLFTKQPPAYVRFISKNGIFTYYETRSGSLMLSTNYQAFEVSKGDPGTNYLIYSSPARKILLFTKDQNYLDFMSQKEANTIFKMGFGKKEAEKIGYGVNPKLHLDDTWCSYFNIQENVIYFQNLQSDALKFKVKINNTKNSYFVPQVEMLDKETVIFTDLSKEGFPGISVFNRANKGTNLLIKGNSPFEKLEICSKDDNLLVGTFGFESSKYGSTIDQIPLKTLNAQSKKNIYKSAKNDIGNFVCDFDKDLIYFVKNYSSNINQVFEVASLNISTKEVKKLTQLLNSTHIFTMDDKLILSAFAKTYVLAGQSNFQKDEFLKEPEKKKVKK